MTTPAAFWLDSTATCPRCHASATMLSTGSGLNWTCCRCEWAWTASTQAPTGTTNAAITAGTTTAISVASGGASFTAGMMLLVDVGSSAEIVRVTATGSATSIPVTAVTNPAGNPPYGGAAVVSFTKNHLSGVTFGQLLLSSTLAVVGGAEVPNAPAWGF